MRDLLIALESSSRKAATLRERIRLALDKRRVGCMLVFADNALRSSVRRGLAVGESKGEGWPGLARFGVYVGVGCANVVRWSGEPGAGDAVRIGVEHSLASRSDDSERALVPRLKRGEDMVGWAESVGTKGRRRRLSVAGD